MTLQEELIKRNYSLLQLAIKLNNIKKACNYFGVSRQHYYNIKMKLEKYGVEGLGYIKRKSPIMPNQTPIDIEEKIINYSLENPSFGKDRISMDMKWEGIWVSASGVHRIWRRNNMDNTKKRIRKLEEKMRNKWFSLSDTQLDALVENVQNLKERHVISFFPGYLLCQDTYYLGHIKGIGKIYMQSVIDTYGSFGFAKLYTTKESIAACDILIDRVLPFYYKLNIPILNILTDNGKEYCGRKKSHNYEFTLELFNIRHRRTKINSPRTNGFAERFHQTVFNEFLYPAFLKKWYYNVEDLQRDLDEWLFLYNFRRHHQGYRVKGRTPFEVISDRRAMPKQITYL